MFSLLADKLQDIFKDLRGQGKITEGNVGEAMRAVRMALLEADVDFNVAKGFISRVKEKALGEEVLRSVTPGQQIVKIFHDELTALLGGGESPLNLEKPGRILMVGLNGAGKTTTSAKLAAFLKKQGRKPVLIASDLHRPAAIAQLATLARQIDVPIYTPPPEEKDVLRSAKAALVWAQENRGDVQIWDTAGRQEIDEPLVQELKQLRDFLQPQEVLLVADAATGQQAVSVATHFHQALEVTGIVLTKLDGDARGGAALTIKEVTGQPIRFLGVGEGMDKLEEFRPEGLASRILGMGDIVGLMKDFEQVVDTQKAEQDAMRMLKGKFDMQDFLEQISVIQQMGSLKDILQKMPLFGMQIPEGANIDDSELIKIKAMISSMTLHERRYPERFIETSWEQVISGGQVKGRRRVAHYHEPRIRRVARGSGRKEAEVMELLHKFALMRQMMLTMGAQAGLLGKIPGLRTISKIKQFAGMDLGAIMNAAGMQQTEMRHSAPRANVDKRREKAKRKVAKEARKRNKKK